MKKLLVIAVLSLLMASMAIAAGCGGSDNGEAKTDETTVTGPLGGEDAADYSPVGTYESDEGKFITLNADGTFETDDWEDMTEGTYMFYEDEAGYWVDLTFEDGTLVVLSVIIGMDEVAALVDDFTLVQYTKK